jgi:radical SAM superfamily enzyme YgiQ (UPF0313 family)
MKVALVKPRSYHLVVSKGTVRLPLGLAYIAASCEKHGHEVKIFDSELIDGELEELIEEILKFNPSFVGLTATTPLVIAADAISKRLHEKRPNIKTMLGGPHCTHLPEFTLDTTDFNAICIGEGEDVVVQYLEKLKKNESFDNIPGLMYKDSDGKILGNTIKAQTKIHETALPARHLLDLKKYIDVPRDIKEPQDIIFTARGCPEKCAFCISADEKLRIRYVEDVLKELDEIVFKYGTKFIIISDDTFTQHKRKTIELCKAIIEKNYNIRYTCQTRLDRVDSEILDWLVKSGCYAICFGIESGSDNILKSMRKDNDLEKIRKNVPMIKSYGFNMRATYIIGWIDETEEEILETIKLAEEIDADENAFCIATPYPGTELWDEAVRRGMKFDKDELTKFHYYHEVGFNMSQVSDERLLELQKEAYRRVPSRVYKVTDE